MSLVTRITADLHRQLLRQLNNRAVEIDPSLAVKPTDGLVPTDAVIVPAPTHDEIGKWNMENDGERYDGLG